MRIFLVAMTFFLLASCGGVATPPSQSTRDEVEPQLPPARSPLEAVVQCEGDEDIATDCLCQAYVLRMALSRDGVGCFEDAEMASGSYRFEFRMQEENSEIVGSALLTEDDFPSEATGCLHNLLRARIGGGEDEEVVIIFFLRFTPSLIE